MKKAQTGSQVEAQRLAISQGVAHFPDMIPTRADRFGLAGRDRSQKCVSQLMPSTVAATLHRYRLAAGYSQEELAERAGISARSISDIERGISRAPRVDTLDGLADALGLSVEERASLHAVARAQRNLAARELPASPGSGSNHGQIQSAVSTAIATSRALTRLRTVSLPTHLTTPRSRLAAGTFALVLIAVGAFMTVHITMSSGASAGIRRFSLWQPVIEQPVVLGRIEALATDREGNVFVATDDAVDALSGLWKLAPSGQVLDHWSRNGRYVVHGDGVAVDRTGNVYIADGNMGRIYKLSPQGHWLGARGSNGTRPGQFIRPGAIAADSRGNIYVGDSTGRIQTFSAIGVLLAVWTNCGVHRLGYCLPAALTTDVHNNLYIARGELPRSVDQVTPQGRLMAQWTSTGDVPSQPLFFPDAVSTSPGNPVVVADSYTGGVYRLAPGHKMQHWLSIGYHDALHSFALTLDRAGEIFESDCCSNRIRKFSADGVLSATWAPFRILPVSLHNPSGISVDQQGSVIAVTAGRFDAVLKFSSSGNRTASWQSEILGRGQAHALSAVTVDAGGNTYVVDALTSRVVELSRAGVQVHAWGGEGSSPGQLENPSGVAVDKNGSLYISDTGNSRVVKLSATGVPDTHWGALVPFAQPQGIALDAEGNVYVADSGMQAVKELSPEGHLLAQWRGTGTEKLVAPTGVAVDTIGHVFVTDTGDSRIKEFTSSGASIAVWGKRGLRPGEFLQPGGIAIDRAGVVWVADTGNNRIQRLTAR